MSITFSFTIPTSFPSSKTWIPIRANPNSMNIKSCLIDYPLASRIMVRNLSYSTKECSLQKEFSKFGQIAEVKLVEDSVTKRPKGYAFIQYTSQDDAMLALENMDYKYFDGRLIYVELAKPVKNVKDGYLKASGPPKQQQEQQHRHLQTQDQTTE